jgi:hypothetical protein
MTGKSPVSSPDPPFRQPPEREAAIKNQIGFAVVCGKP